LAVSLTLPRLSLAGVTCLIVADFRSASSADEIIPFYRHYYVQLCYF